MQREDTTSRFEQRQLPAQAAAALAALLVWLGRITGQIGRMSISNGSSAHAWHSCLAPCKPGIWSGGGLKVLSPDAAQEQAHKVCFDGITSAGSVLQGRSMSSACGSSTRSFIPGLPGLDGELQTSRSQGKLQKGHQREYLKPARLGKLFLYCPLPAAGYTAEPGARVTRLRLLR